METYLVTEIGTYEMTRVIEAESRDEAEAVFCRDWIADDGLLEETERFVEEIGK